MTLQKSPHQYAEHAQVNGAPVTAGVYYVLQKT
jgi:hypothetical protein